MPGENTDADADVGVPLATGDDDADASEGDHDFEELRGEDGSQEVTATGLEAAPMTTPVKASKGKQSSHPMAPTKMKTKHADAGEPAKKVSQSSDTALVVVEGVKLRSKLNSDHLKEALENFKGKRKPMD